MDDRKILLAVLEACSFTRAAHKLGISTSYASRRVRALEDALGARLLDRTTRSVAPTEVGAAYVARLGPLLEGLAEADALVRAESVVPSGRLRVALPLSFGLVYVVPVLTAYACRYERVTVDASFSDRDVDLMTDGFDVAIRGGRLVDSSLAARRLCGVRGMIAASPAYLASHGVPEHPTALRQHRSVDYTAYRSADPWTLTRGHETSSARPTPVFLSDNGDALREAAVAGLGITAQPDFVLAPALRSGALVEVLGEWTGWSGGIWALSPSHRLTAAKVRLFLEMMAEAFAPPGR